MEAAGRYMVPLFFTFVSSAVMLGIHAGAQVVHTENVTVMEGETAEIACKLHSYDRSIVVIQNPYRQTLFFNGTRALKDDRFQLVSFTSNHVRISLSDVRVQDEGGYYCQLYAEDTHHQVAVLTVLVPPLPVVEPIGPPATENGAVSLECRVARSKPAAVIRWYRDKKPLQGMIRQEQEGKIFTVSSSLVFPVTRRDNGGIVTCEADLPGVKGQRHRTDYTLDVRYAPSVKMEAPSSILREGDDLVLSCAVSGNPLPSHVSWSRLNESLPARAESAGTELTITRLTPADNGTYVCEAVTDMGKDTDHYTLVVYDRGAIVEQQNSLSYAMVGGVLALLVFVLICALTITAWFSVRQKGSYLTHEASRLDEHGEVREAFINGGDSHDLKKEYFI